MGKPLLPFERHAILFLLKHCAWGVFGGFLVGTLLLYYNIAGLYTLTLGGSRPEPIGLFLLFFGLFVTFGSIGMGIGIMSQADDRN